jgi:anti-sigma B factor antagonist
MLIRTWSLDDITIVDVSGRVGVENGSALRDAIATAVDGGARHLLLNLTGVTGIDAAGVGELARAAALIGEREGELRLVLRSEAVRVLLIRTRLLAVLPTYSSEAEAIAAFEAPQLV